MRSLILLTLALTLTFSTMARSYQVARIHGVITKISGDRVKVQDDKNQIFWVERTKAYPIGSQIGDDVVIYQKVRFKTSYNNNTTTFFIKHRTTPMIKAVRKFFVSYEKQMGFKYKKKKKYTFYDRIQSLFSIKTAHAQAKKGDPCYIGGRKSIVSIESNGDIICEMPSDDRYSCGEDGKGFRCSPAVFYGKEVSNTDAYLKSILYFEEDTKDKGFCIKHDDRNISRRCYNAALKAYGSESKADDQESRERIIKDLYENLGEDSDTIKEELNQMVQDINKLCEDAEDAAVTCDEFEKDIEKVEESLLDKAELKELKKQASEDVIRADETKRLIDQIEEYKKSIGQGGQAQQQSHPYMINPQGNSSQPAVYQIMTGSGMPAGHTPMFAQMGMPGMNTQQPVIFIVVPTPPNQASNGGSQLQGFLDYLKANGYPVEDKRNNQSDNDNRGDKDDPEEVDDKPSISLSTYAYANKLENCKAYSAEICLVKQEDGSYKNYKDENGDYKEFEAAKYNHENGTIDVNGQSFFIEELINTDPSLKWECDVAPNKAVESQGVSCAEASETNCKLYDEEGNLIIERMGYLSKLHSQAFKDGGQFTYEFDSYNKKATVSPALPTKSSDTATAPVYGSGIAGGIAAGVQNATIAIEESENSLATESQELSDSRHPPLFYSACEEYDSAKDEPEKMVRADMDKSCIKIAAFTPCEHGECTKEEQKEMGELYCQTDISCKVIYKNAFNKSIGDQSENITLPVTLPCKCELGNPDNVDVASCIDNSKSEIIKQTRDNQPTNTSQQ